MRPGPPASSANDGAARPAAAWLPLLLALAAAAAYSGSFKGPFVLDDIPSIDQNRTIRSLATALAPPVASTEGGRPVLNLSMALNYAAGGTSVGGFHAVNLAIHILSALALLGIVRRTLLLRKIPWAEPAAFSAALLWSVHPLLTGSVTYLSQRAESLMGLFFLTTLYCFVRGSEPEGRRSWLVLSVAACLLGMGTKEVMAVAPLVVLLYDRTFLAGSFAASLRKRAWAYSGLAATWIALAFLVASTHGRGGTAGFNTGVAWTRYAMTQVEAVAHYLRLSFWPSPLVFDYGTPLAKPSPGLLLDGAVLSVLLAATAFGLMRRTAAGFLGAAFFLILAPSSSFVPVATETMAEHRMYLPLAALAVLVVTASYRLLGRGTLAAVLALSAALAGATWHRNQDYRSAESLWQDTVGKLPGNDRARNGIGVLLKNEGHLDEAAAQFEEAIQINPGNVDARVNLGTVLAQQGHPGEAVRLYEEAIAIRPNSSEAHSNLGDALQTLGRHPEAASEFSEAARLDPGNAAALNNLANCLASDGRAAEAIPNYQAALKIEPGNADIRSNLGSSLSAVGRPGEALPEFEEALRLQPGSAGAHNNLGNTLNKLGRTAEAAAQYAEAARLSPGVAGFHLNLAVTLLRLPGKSSEAVSELNEVLRIDPNNAAAQQILARARASGL